VENSPPALTPAYLQSVWVAMELGGVLSGEHGIGVLKRDYLADNLDPQALAMMRAIKHAFDPKNIMNPGKVLTPS